MKLTAELSLYPLQEQYIPVIQAFIDAMHQHQDMVVVGNAMSTQICGDFDRVMELVGAELKRSYQQHGSLVLVCKFIPGELAIQT